MTSESFLKPDTIIFLGAGASIHAGINGVIKLVEDFNEWLQLNRKVDYLDINRKILDIIKKSESENMNGNTEIDIEDLLMTVEKLENSSKDILLDFYEGSFPILSTCNGYNLISGGKTLLSQEIKNFIKTTFTEKGLNVDYLKPLVDLARDYRPLHIFSTNYDTCIERFCLLNGLKYVDGFNPQWDLNQFNRTDIDVRLYKLHGSIGWFRSEQGDYVRSDVKIGGTRARLNTNQDVVPLILYPGKKFEYIEPMFDMLLEFKRQLDYAKYVFVVGYSFKDDHLSKLFRYAAKRNPPMTIFLITPSSHDIYYHSLKRHGDAEFIHSYSHESYSMIGYNTTQPTKLEGNVICLPYRFENVIHLLNNRYLANLIEAQKCESDKEFENDHSFVNGTLIRWHECLSAYANCEHLEKIEDMINKKISWDKLMMIDYQLGIEIIVKAFLNTFLWEPGRKKWLGIFKKYSPVSADNIQVNISENNNLFIKFQHSSQTPVFGSDAFEYYKHLQEIYEGHIVFANSKASSITDNLGITEVRSYLEPWKENNLTSDTYIKLRSVKYSEKIGRIEYLVSALKNDSSFHKDNLLSEIRQIEVQELETLIH